MTDIIVEVEDGVVIGVYSSQRDVNVRVLDRDAETLEGERREEELEIETSNMFEVY